MPPTDRPDPDPCPAQDLRPAPVLTDRPPRTFWRSALAAGLSGLCVLYLANPTGGFVELIPDWVPVIGNLDEAGAVLLLLKCLRYFGIDLTRIPGAARDADPGQER